MSVGTFTPQPGAAPLPRQVAVQARMESKLMLRNGEQLLLAVVIPVIVLVGAVEGAKHLDKHLTVNDFTPGVLALAVMSTAFTSLAIATGFERRYGVIKRLGSSPLPRSGLLLGKIGALLMVEVMQLIVLALVGLALRWSPTLSGGAIPGFVLGVVLGTAAFASWGLAMAGALRAEATLAAANLVYLLLLAAGAVVLPPSSYGGWGKFAQWLPSGALGDAVRGAFLHGHVVWPALAVLLGWAIVGTVVTARSFKWE